MEAQLHHGSPLMVDHTPGADVAAGEVVVVGDGCRIAHADIPADRLGALAIRGGVYRVPKSTAAGSAIAAGKSVYWDATNNVQTTNAAAGANKFLGTTVAATADADAFGYVAHDQPAP